MTKTATKTTESRTYLASKELSKALTKIGKTDPEMQKFLGEVLADAMGSFRIAHVLLGEIK